MLATASKTVAKGAKKTSHHAAHAKPIGLRTREKTAELAINLVEFQKTTFDNTAKVVGSIQEQTEKMLMDIVAKSAWMPKEAKTAINEWIKLARRSRADFTKTVDKSLDLMGEYVKRLESPAPAAKSSGKPKAVRRKPARRVKTPSAAAR